MHQFLRIPEVVVGALITLIHTGNQHQHPGISAAIDVLEEIPRFALTYFALPYTKNGGGADHSAVLRKVYAGRKQRIEEAGGIAYQHVARATEAVRHIGVILLRPYRPV